MARSRHWPIAIGCALALLASTPAAAARVQDPQTTLSPSTITVLGGLNDPHDPTIVVNEFLPSAVTVRTGTQITWEMAGPEPHSVTFVPAGSPTPPSLDTDLSLLLPTPPTAPYDGTTFVNSGVVPLGHDVARFSMSFASPGRYTYFCVVHPAMIGTVDVTGSREQSATAAAHAGGAQRAKYLAEGEAAKAKLLARSPAPTGNSDGTTTYRVSMGASTRHTEILAFAPSPKHVARGDHITFVNESGAPHTASFGGPLVPPNPEVDEVRQPVPGSTPQPLTSDAYLNTGWLLPASDRAPGAPHTYTFDAPNPGTFSYVCVLHVGSGMVGTIDVGG